MPNPPLSERFLRRRKTAPIIRVIFTTEGPPTAAAKHPAAKNLSARDGVRLIKIKWADQW
jgi:hypothetical protein